MAKTNWINGNSYKFEVFQAETIGDAYMVIK